MPLRRLRRAFDAIAIALIVVLAAFAVARLRGGEAPIGTASAFALPSSDGGTLSLRVPPGRFTILEFGASWCEPCRRAMPVLVRYARGRPGVALLSVDEGETPPAVAAFARAEGLTRMAIDADGAVGARYGTSGLPTIVAVDARGRIRARYVGNVPGLAEALERTRNASAESSPRAR